MEIAYPLSAVPSPHRVILRNGPPLRAMCAIDALGIPYMARSAATIVSHDPGSGQEIRVSRQEDGSWRWEPQEAVVVLAAAECTGRIAGACLHTAFHASPDLAARYLADDARQQGHVLTQAQALAVAETEFGPLLAPEPH